MKIKKIIAGMLAIAFVVCTSGVTAKAASLKDEQKGKIGDWSVWATTSITPTGATCITGFTGTGATSVTGTYYYVNFRTVEVGVKTLGTGGRYGVSVSFSAPTDCRSVRVNGSHRVSCGAQYWGATTEAIYR